MDGKDLLKALMQEAGLNPNALANVLKNRSLQSQVTRFLDGSTTNPRWSTLKPVADHFNVRVEAFLDPEAAEIVARQRGLHIEHEHRASEPLGAWGRSTSEAPNSAAPTPIKAATAQPTLVDLLMQLAATLEPYDLSARKAVASLLGDLATAPETASITADRIQRLLGAPGNDVQRLSSSSLPHN